MTKFTISLILAIIFVVVCLSTPLLPCNDIKDLDFCKLEGEQKYFYTEKLSNPWAAGGVAFVLSLLIVFTVFSIIFPKRKYIPYK